MSYVKAVIIDVLRYVSERSIDHKTLVYTKCYNTESGVSFQTGINSVAMAEGPRVGLVAMVGGPSSAVDQAVADALIFGAPMVVPAGDDNADACNYSPARVESVRNSISFSKKGQCRPVRPI